MNYKILNFFQILFLFKNFSQINCQNKSLLRKLDSSDDNDDNSNEYQSYIIAIVVLIVLVCLISLIAKWIKTRNKQANRIRAVNRLRAAQQIQLVQIQIDQMNNNRPPQNNQNYDYPYLPNKNNDIPIQNIDQPQEYVQKNQDNQDTQYYVEGIPVQEISSQKKQSKNNNNNVPVIAAVQI